MKATVHDLGSKLWPELFQLVAFGILLAIPSYLILAENSLYLPGLFLSSQPAYHRRYSGRGHVSDKHTGYYRRGNSAVGGNLLVRRGSCVISRH